MSSFNRKMRSISTCIDDLYTETASHQLFITALTTLSTITRNIVAHPNDAKYRRLNLSSPALSERVGRWQAGREFLRLIGFEKAAAGGEAGAQAEAEDGRLVLGEEADAGLLELALQVLSGSLEEVKREEEKKGGKEEEKELPAVDGMQQEEDEVQEVQRPDEPQSDAQRAAAEQEKKDRKLSFQLQRHEDVRARLERQQQRASTASASRDGKDEANFASLSAEDGSDNSEPMETEADLRVNLQASYNISDVKRSLTALHQQIIAALTASAAAASPAAGASPAASSSSSSSSSFPSSASGSADGLPVQHAISEAYLSSLSLLSKITANLLIVPRADKYRSINLRNATISSKLAAYPAALDFLSFLGFKREGEGGEGSELLRLRGQDEDRVKVERALSIVQRVAEENRPSEEELEYRQMPPLDREVRVMEYQPAFLNPNLARPEDVAPEAPDMKLLLSVAAEDRRMNELLSRTDIFVTRHKQAELKQRFRRKYSRTLLRVICQPDNSIITAYFRPLDPLHLLFSLLSSYLAPSAPPAFVLRLPPQQKLTLAKDGQRTFASLGLVPAATLYIGREDEDRGAAATAWLRDDVNRSRGRMEVVPVPVAENAAEIAEKRREERMGGVAGAMSAAAVEKVEEKGEEDELDNVDLEKEMERRMAAAERAKKKQKGTPAGSSGSSSSSGSRAPAAGPRRAGAKS